MKSEEELQPNNQEKLRELIGKLGITQIQATELLNQKTRPRTIAHRTLKTWLGKPELKSSRPCPEWPLGILQKELNDI